MKLGDRYLVMNNGFLSDCIIICSLSIVQNWSAFLRISRQILSNKNNMRFFKTIKLKLERVSFNYRLMAKLLNYFRISNVVSLFKVIIFWEGHKSSSRVLTLLTNVQTLRKISLIFCGLLRKPELYGLGKTNKTETCVKKQIGIIISW